MDICELKDKVENIEISYDYEKTYNELYNTMIDAWNDGVCLDSEELFLEYIDYETAENIAETELRENGLARLYYFLGDANVATADVFRINAYGNLEEVDFDDLQNLKDELLDYIEDEMEVK